MARREDLSRDASVKGVEAALVDDTFSDPQWPLQQADLCPDSSMWITEGNPL